MPAARTIIAPGRGELFLRDTGGHGPVVMLLHGWVASADLNWCGAYDALAAAGYRVLAIDHRGHGRGLRPLTPFRLSDCAGDAAAALRLLDASPAIVVGYSMGGAIAQLMARDHPTSSAAWSSAEPPSTGRIPRPGVRSRRSGWSACCCRWRRERRGAAGLRRVGLRDSAETAWVLSEAMRHSVPDLVEAGRELGRFDSRSWLAPLPIPTAVVLTSRDDAVPPRKQHELAGAARRPGVRGADQPPRDHDQRRGLQPGTAPGAIRGRSGTLKRQMRRARIITALTTVALLALATAPAALAGVSHGGEGWYGETSDTVITNAMFMTIIFFPTIIIIFSLIQWRLDKRKHARMAAAKARAKNADWRGGW